MNYPLDEILLPMGGNTVKDVDKMDALWDDPNYIAEEKYDGSRYVSVGGRFFSRKLSVKTGYPVEKTDNVPHLHFLQNLPDMLILDGEINYEGMTSNEVTSIMGASADKAMWRQGFGEFQPPYLVGSKGKWRKDGTQPWMGVAKKEMEYLLEHPDRKPLKYVVFDILRDMEGNWLIDKPWHERRSILESVVSTIWNNVPSSREFLEISSFVQYGKRDFYKKIMERNGEGVMLKDMFGAYFPDKKPVGNWVKVKKHITADVIITGFKPAKREYKGDEHATHPWWEAINGDIWQLSGAEEAERVGKEVGYPLAPVTKFYAMKWIGSIVFSKYAPRYKLCHSDSGYLYTKEEIVNTIRQDYEAEGTTPEEKGFDIETHIEDFYDKVMVLVEVGDCSGISEELRQNMTENPSKYIGQVMEIGAMEGTKDGFYRHPQFSRLRDDKNASECVVGVD